MSVHVLYRDVQRVASVGVACAVRMSLRGLEVRRRNATGRAKAAGSVGVAFVAGLFLIAAGVAAFAQMQSIPPVSADASASTNSAVSRREQPPDGDISQMSSAPNSLAQAMVQYLDQALDAEVEIWVDAQGAISFAAVYKPGKAAEATGGELSAQDKDRVNGLLKELGAEASAVRKKATEELKKFGGAVVPLVQAHKARESDPEVVDRCRQVLAAVDGRLVVRDYEAMIGAIKGVRLSIGSDGMGKRYVVPVSAEWFARWMRRRLR